MSTYNGAEYIGQQIDSILAQTLTDWILMVRDDGSVDNTMDILQDYEQRFPDKIRILPNGGKNVGVVKSFELLLVECKDAEYIQFADQDDVWMQDKLEKCLNRMHEAEDELGRNIPLLVHCDLQVVNSRLELIAPSFWRYVNFKTSLLDNEVHYLAIGNSVAGCATLINQAVRQVALPFQKGIYMHDAWIGQQVLLSGGKIIAIDEPLMQYRLHDDNVCGVRRYKFSITNLREKILLAHRSYQTAHPLVFKNKLHFFWWKMRYFIRLHIVK